MTSPVELVATHQTVKQLYDFMARTSKITTKLELPLEATFQCLMHLGMGEVQDFDKQARDGNVPMHQAKVLDRNTTLKSLEVEPALRQMISEDELRQLVANCGLLRNFLRMKVEDGNDLSMARKMISLTLEYLDTIKHYSDGDPKRMFELYTAETEEAVNEAIHSSNAMESTVGSAGFGSTISTFEGTLARRGKPAPSDARGFMSGVKAEIAKLDATQNVGERQASLQVLCGWVQEVGQDVLDDCFEALLTTLSNTMKVFLSEKRSILLKLACSIASFLAIRCRPELIADTRHQSKVVRETITTWLDCLLKGVHVTVAAIARATDETVRDLVIASYGSSYVVRKLFAVLGAAQQPELRKRVLNFLSIGLLSARPEACDDYIREGTLLLRLLSQGDAQTRRAARLLVGVARLQGVEIMFGALDPKIGKAMDSEEREVREMGNTIEMFELNVLRYEEPSKAALYWDLVRLEDSPQSPQSPYSPPAKRREERSSASICEREAMPNNKRAAPPAPPRKSDLNEPAYLPNHNADHALAEDDALPWEMPVPDVVDTVAHLCGPASPSPERSLAYETPEKKPPVAGRRQVQPPEAANKWQAPSAPTQHMPDAAHANQRTAPVPVTKRAPPTSIYASKPKAPVGSLTSRPSSGGVPLSLSLSNVIGSDSDAAAIPRQRTPAELLTSLKRRSSSRAL